MKANKNRPSSILPRQMAKRAFHILALSWILGVALGAQSAEPEFFADQVQPILTKNCLGCHNEKLKLSGFSMASRKSMIAGGKRGPAVVPGDLSGSRMVAAIRHTNRPQMPPGRKLSDPEIQTLEQWITGGAVWPAERSMASGAKPNHWSFVPPRRPAEPQVSNKRWARTPIDKFILARLDREQITPSPEAPKLTLLRRLYLDLTGLPPGLEEIRAFENDKSSDAWVKVIDKLLASPHFGERWGRKWLDQARYADSDGGSRDEPRSDVALSRLGHSGDEHGQAVRSVRNRAAWGRPVAESHARSTHRDRLPP